MNLLTVFLISGVFGMIHAVYSTKDVPLTLLNGEQTTVQIDSMLEEELGVEILRCGEVLVRRNHGPQVLELQCLGKQGDEYVILEFPAEQE